MPSISDKLKSMGVKIGATDIPQPPKPAVNHSLEEILSGREIETHQGNTFLVETYYPIGKAHGDHKLDLLAPLNVLGHWAGDERIGRLQPESYAFLDTETTGLSGGAGTQAFLIGIGRFTMDDFQLAQFFLREPIEEPAQLAACEEFLAPCEAVVTFNGKSFDIPLLASRYNFHGWHPPFGDMAHIDLLHLARRLWRELLPSRTLLSLETHILGSTRSEADVPGWMAPALYFEYLRYGDPSPLKSVLYHNAMDVVSLAVLMDHMGAILADPLEAGGEHSINLIALAKLFEDMGELGQATQLYLHALNHVDVQSGELPEPLLLGAIMRLAHIYKRREDFPKAIDLWKEACEYSHLDAYIELAKYYEHRDKDYENAIFWTKSALNLIEDRRTHEDSGNQLSRYEKLEWGEELEHRLRRLERKYGKSS